MTNDRQKISADLVRAHAALDALARLGRDLGSVASEAEACKRIVADAQDVVRRFAFDEAAIRADERARIVGVLRGGIPDGGGREHIYADFIEQGAHRPKGERS